MTTEVLAKILEPLQGIISSNGFESNETGDQFQNNRFAFRVSHDEANKMLQFEVAEVAESGEVGEFKSASSWLFEEPENLRDAESAGLDFLDSLKTYMGIRNLRTNRNGEVALPRKESGATPNVEALAVKTLAVFPALKETYKEHVSYYGSFLAIEFFKTTLAKKLGELLDEKNKKSLKKVFAMLGDMYEEGDRQVQNIIVGVVLCGAVRGYPTREATALEYLDDYNFLKTAFVNIMARAKTDKRFAEMLGE